MFTRFRRIAPAALFIAAPLGACGCWLGSAAAPPNRDAGTLVDERCDARVPDPARCARLFVFENRQTRSGRIIPLRIVVLRATGSQRAPDPVFFLAGGPGQAATHMVGGYARGFQGLRVARDLVFVDQRGTGESNALTCSFYGPPNDPQSYFDQFLPPEKVRACRERLEATADLTQYTTMRSVEDLEEVRVALGYDRINLVGGSYGTRLAMEYVRRYEPRVRTVILDGPVSPASHVPEDFGQRAQHALDLLMHECDSTEACRAAFPGIRQKAGAIFERLKQAPARATIAHRSGGRAAEVRLTRENVAEAIRYMTYSAADAAKVPLYLEQAYDGDYSPIARFLLEWRAEGTFDGLYLSITCTEDVPFVAPGAEQRDERSYLGGYRIREQRAACDEWPRGDVPDWVGRPVASRVPVLLISGQLDPVTAPAEAAAIARTLPAARHITIPFGAHSHGGLSGIGCLTVLRERFITLGNAERLETGCVSEIARPGFISAQ